MNINAKEEQLVRISKELNDAIIEMTELYDKEDRQEREERRPLWTKLENYFNGLQRIYWDNVARDWRILDYDKNYSNRHYDKVINDYRALAESIIAALSVRPPSAIFYPDDADVEEDVTTAKICVKIKELIERHNQAQLLIIKALLILFNQGTFCSYVYNESNSAYGTYTVPKYGENTFLHTTLLNCPECGSNISEISGAEKTKVPEETAKCLVCGYVGIPQQEEYEEEIPNIIGSSVQAKARTCIEIFSPLFVYLPFYAREQKHIPYLRLRFEQHISMLREIYPKLKKKGQNPKLDENADERSIYVGVNANNLTTVDCWWIRPWAYQILENKDDQIKELKRKYPDGLYAVMIDKQIVDIHNESLDDHWRISNNPLSTYIHGEPLGKGVAPIQDLQNEVVDLQIETFEHAIPETHARADVVDFDKYSKSQAAPGMMYPAKAPADGTPLSQAFHTIKTATMSEEADLFLKRLQEKGQFISSAFPSIYGGPAMSGSKTAREYSESRSMALQRLSIPWNILKYAWADTMSIAVPLQIHALRTAGEDEKVVDRTKTGFINNWIRQSDLNGRIGKVEADADEDLPQSAAQIKDVLVQLMTLKDEYINSALYHPQNIPMIAKALGAPDFYIPGNDDRNKQFSEFDDLLNGITVEVKPWENHQVEAETCKSFLISATGQVIKRNNPEGWAAIESHMMEHENALSNPQPAPEAVNSETGGSNNGSEELGSTANPTVVPFPGR